MNRKYSLLFSLHIGIYFSISPSRSKTLSSDSKYKRIMLLVLEESSRLAQPRQTRLYIAQIKPETNLRRREGIYEDSTAHRPAPDWTKHPPGKVLAQSRETLRSGQGWRVPTHNGMGTGPVRLRYTSVLPWQPASAPSSRFYI